jgi:hypothetical protein
MMIIIQGGTAEKNEILHDAKHVSVKFVMVSDDKEIQTHLFGTYTQHSHYADAFLDARPQFRLVGAGFVRKEIPEWGSESCKEEYGYDRPKDPPAADQLLADIRELL